MKYLLIILFTFSSNMIFSSDIKGTFSCKIKKVYLLEMNEGTLVELSGPVA